MVELSGIGEWLLLVSCILALCGLSFVYKRWPKLTMVAAIVVAAILLFLLLT